MMKVLQWLGDSTESIAGSIHSRISSVQQNSSLQGPWPSALGTDGASYTYCLGQGSTPGLENDLDHSKVATPNTFQKATIVLAEDATIVGRESWISKNAGDMVYLPGLSR